MYDIQIFDHLNTHICNLYYHNDNWRRGSFMVFKFIFSYTKYDSLFILLQKYDHLYLLNLG